MKKLLCLVLSAALLTGLTVPALAADTADERLAAVTLKVKQTLDLDTDAYDSFSGDYYEDALSPVWYLNWSGEDTSLRIQADEAGNIMYYYYSDASSASYNDNFSPSFPDGDEASARAAAGAFLSKVLDTSLESVELEPDTDNGLGSTRFNYYGTMLLRGLPSPLSYSISVRAEDNTVLRFSRDSLYTKYLTSVPSAQPAADAGGAGVKLQSTLALRLEYVLSDDGKTAVLRYLPESGDEYFVDAQTGELTDLTALYQGISDQGQYGLGEKSASTADAAETGTLTDAEAEGVAKLEGVLSKEELDAALRQISQLGLGSYTLSAATYSVNRSDGDVSCRLQYVKTQDGNLWRRYVAVDAKTGALRSVYSSVPWMEDMPETAVTAEEANAVVQGFLSEYYAGNYPKLALYDSSDAGGSNYDLSHSFRYAQRENGYFYTGNYYNVSIDATDGSISSLSYHFDEALTFDSADGIIPVREALDAYYNTYTVELGYLDVPEALDPNAPDVLPLIEAGYSYLYSLRLAYTLQEQETVLGIDAKTGEPVVYSQSEPVTVSYYDMDGHWARAQAEKLARYNVGWLGGFFRPDRQLTQFDLLCLLVSTRGYLYDPASDNDGSADYVYTLAYGAGLLTRAERDDDALVTRGELVRFILNAAGYGEVANLSGIYRCSFMDEGSIPAAYYGYAALAQGLGLVSGDGTGAFACGRTATRAEAAVMLYNLMSR